MDLDTDRTKSDCGEKISFEEALECALDHMEKGTALHLAEGVRKAIREKAYGKFKANHGDWPKKHERVLRAARKIGEYSEEFARFDAEMHNKKPTVVNESHVWAAIAVVSQFCNARVFRGDEGRMKWCPEP